MEVIEVHLDHCGPPAERRLALIDKNRDLYLSTVRNFGKPAKVVKLGECVLSII